MAEDHVLYLQNRSKRAGAQVSLSRLLTQPSLQALRPHVLLGTSGWLADFFTNQSISHTVATWPSPRSLAGRLGGLQKFAQGTICGLREQGITVRAIVANDHQECLLAHALAKAAAGAPVIVILRTPGMTLRDFEKYRCGDCDQLFTRGQELTEKVSSWNTREAACMLGSFAENDRLPAPTPSQSAPTRILIAGSEEPRKGFQDFLAALRIVEAEDPDFPPLDVVFTGNKTETLEALTSSGFRSSFTFVGRVDNFQQFAREFPLAIHPSRAETFGMAPIELILAGVPTMLSDTGVATDLQLPDHWVFPPQSPQALADCLIHICNNWPNSLPDILALQQHMLDTFPISDSAGMLAKSLSQLGDV